MRSLLVDIGFYFKIKQFLSIQTFQRFLEKPDSSDHSGAFLFSAVQINLYFVRVTKANHRKIILRFYPKRRRKNQQLGIDFRIKKPTINANQTAQRTSTNSRIFTVFFGPVIFINTRFQRVCDEPQIFFPFRIFCNGIIIKNIFLDSVIVAVFHSDYDEFTTSVFRQKRQFFINFPIAVSRTFIKQILRILKVKHGISFLRFVIIVRQKRPNFSGFIKLRNVKRLIYQFHRWEKFLFERSPI